jgi:hypothetical protein
VLRSYRDKKVVGVFVRFRAPLHRLHQAVAAFTQHTTASQADSLCQFLVAAAAT